MLLEMHMYKQDTFAIVVDGIKVKQRTNCGQPSKIYHTNPWKSTTKV